MLTQGLGVCERYLIFGFHRALREPQVHRAPCKAHLRGFLQRLPWGWGHRILQLSTPPPPPVSQGTRCFLVPSMFFGKTGSGAWHPS